MRYTTWVLLAIALGFGNALAAKVEIKHELGDARRAILVQNFIGFCPDFTDKADTDLHLTLSYEINSAFGVEEDPGEYAEHMLHLTLVTFYEASVRETQMPPCKNLWGAYTDLRKTGRKSSQAIFMASIQTIVSDRLRRKDY